MQYIYDSTVWVHGTYRGHVINSLRLQIETHTLGVAGSVSYKYAAMYGYLIQEENAPQICSSAGHAECTTIILVTGLEEMDSAGDRKKDIE